MYNNNQVISMMNKVEKLIEKKDYIVPSLLILNYKKINLTAEELVFIIYVINNGEDFNPKKISQDLDLNLDKIMDLINNLTNKGLINLEIKKIYNVRSEYFNIEKIYMEKAMEKARTQKYPLKLTYMPE